MNFTFNFRNFTNTIALLVTSITASAQSNPPLNEIKELRDDEVFAPVLRVKSISLYPSDNSLDIKIIAYVNGIEFRYPPFTEGSVPVPKQAVKLPPAESYEIRFEMFIRGQGSASSNTAPRYRQVMREFNAKAQYVTPQDTQRLSTSGQTRLVPIRANYKVYQVVGDTRLATVRGLIQYEISTERICYDNPC